jgi:hypothetical protein
VEELVREELKQHFRPEFLNRIDDIIIFHSLDEKGLSAIVEIQLQRLRDRLAKQQLALELDAAATRHLAKEGYDPQFGARPLKRAIQQLLLDPLAMKLLDGEINPTYWLTRFVILALARLRLSDRLPGGCQSNCSVARRAWADAGAALHGTRRRALRLPVGGLPPNAQRVLGRRVGHLDAGRLLDGRGALAGGAARLCQCHHPVRALGALHVHRQHRPGLVLLRLGNPTAGNRLPGHLSLPVAGWPPVPAPAAADGGLLALSLADFPHHAWGRFDQAARGLRAGAI